MLASYAALKRVQSAKQGGTDMSDVLVTGLFLLIGVLLGVGLNEGAWWYRRRWLEGQERRSIRAALELEYEYNRAALCDWWDSLYELTATGSAEDQEFENRRRLATAPLPSWSALMWQSNAAKLTRILTEDEFKLLVDRYASLDTFTVQHAALHSEFAEARQQNKEDPLSWGGAKATFVMHTRAAWETCREIHETFAGREVALTLDK
jgi:hypothetical protein